MLAIAALLGALALVPAAGAAVGIAGGGTTPTPQPARSVEIVRIVRPPASFDFVDAAIGAAFGAAALAVLGGLVIALHHDGSRVAT